MKVFSVQNILPGITHKPAANNKPAVQTSQRQEPHSDSFEKSSLSSYPHRNVQFLGGIVNVNNDFEIKFTRTFFKKI